MAWSTTATSPSGRRTATAQLRTPRIITPSMTAWPPTWTPGADSAWRPSRAPRRAAPTRPASPLMRARTRPGSGRRLGTALAAGQLALEALHAAAGVDELLLARVEGVADAADLHPDLRLGG